MYGGGVASTHPVDIRLICMRLKYNYCIQGDICQRFIFTSFVLVIKEQIHDLKLHNFILSFKTGQTILQKLLGVKISQNTVFHLRSVIHYNCISKMACKSNYFKISK